MFLAYLAYICRFCSIFYATIRYTSNHMKPSKLLRLSGREADEQTWEAVAVQGLVPLRIMVHVHLAVWNPGFKGWSGSLIMSNLSRSKWVNLYPFIYIYIYINLSMIGNQCLQRSNCSALSIHSCPLVCIRCRSKKPCKTTPLHSQTSDGWRFSNIGIVSHITSLMRSQVSLSTRSESWTGTSISKTSLVGKEHDQHWDVRGTGK